MKRKAIIIGAGISGLASAISLQKSGYDVVIYEKSPVLRGGGSGISLWNNALNALSLLGVSEKVYENSVTLHNSEIISASGITLSKIPLHKFSKKYGSHTVGILRSQLHSILLEKCPNIKINTNHHLINILQDKDKVTACFENGLLDSGDLLIGADGIHSNVRKQFFPETSLRWSGYTSWRGIANLEHSYCKDGFMFEAWGKGNRFGFVPVSKNQVYWFATQNSDHSSNYRKKHKVELLQIFNEYVEPIPTVIEATRPEDIMKTDIYDLSPLSNWTSGKVVLIGDAAHATTPNLGQGASLALEDAVELGNCLLGRDAIEDKLKLFQSKRIKRAHLVVHLSWKLGQFAQVENPVLCFLRNTLVKATPGFINQIQFKKTIGYKINEPFNH